MVMKRIDLIPIGLEETIQCVKDHKSTKIIWREIGFLKYFGQFKKLLPLTDIHPHSL